VRPQRRYGYALIKNSSGALVQAATPVWLLISTSECRMPDAGELHAYSADAGHAFRVMAATCSGA
jgi:hypothetical protein